MVAFVVNSGVVLWVWQTRVVPVDLQFLGVVGGIVIEAVAYRLRFGRMSLPPVFRLDAIVILPVLIYWDVLIFTAPIR